jgi:hypothetical protein
MGLRRRRAVATRRGRRWCRALALCALLLTAAPATIALGDERSGDAGGQDPPRATDRVVKIGPQAVVIVDELGNVRMWEDDPSRQAPACRSSLACWGGALQIFTGFAIASYEDVTTNTEGMIGDR